MRHYFKLLVCLWSFSGFAQLYIKEQTSFTLGHPQTILSSQETHNQIDAPISGLGTLYLHKTTPSPQYLRSTQNVLELSALHLDNADVSHIQTALKIRNQLQLNRGQLLLYHHLELPNPLAVVLGPTASIQPTANGQLVFQTTLEPPLASLLQTPIRLSYSVFQRAQIHPQPLMIAPSFSNFGIPYNNGYEVLIKTPSPPPRAV